MVNTYMSETGIFGNKKVCIHILKFKGLDRVNLITETKQREN